MSTQKVRHYLKVELLFARRTSKEGFGADLQTSGITHGMSINTFEIYQNLRR
jgi:hypothetical protein